MRAKVGDKRANFNLVGVGAGGAREAGVARLVMRKLTRKWNEIPKNIYSKFGKLYPYNDAKETTINENDRFIDNSCIFRLAHRKDRKNFNKMSYK